MWKKEENAPCCPALGAGPSRRRMQFEMSSGLLADGHDCLRLCCKEGNDRGEI